MKFVRIDKDLEKFDKIMHSKTAMKILYAAMFEGHHQIENPDLNAAPTGHSVDMDTVTPDDIIAWTNGRTHASQFMNKETYLVKYALDNPEWHGYPELMEENTTDLLLRNITPYSCHWIADVYLYVATQMYPKEGFFKMTGWDHTTIMNKTMTKVFDPQALYKALQDGNGNDNAHMDLEADKIAVTALCGMYPRPTSGYRLAVLNGHEHKIEHTDYKEVGEYRKTMQHNATKAVNFMNQTKTHLYIGKIFSRAGYTKEQMVAKLYEGMEAA